MPRRPLRQPNQDQALPSQDQIRTLLAEAQALSARLAALNEIAAVMQSSLDTTTVLATLAREARWVLDFQHCSVTEHEGGYYSERVLHPAAAGQPPQISRWAAAGPIGEALRTGRAMILADLRGQPGFPEGMGSGLILPLRSRGQVLGTLNFYARQPGHYRQDDLRIAAALAAQAAVVVQNTTLYREVSKAHNELQTILSSISDGVIVVGHDGRTFLINPAARELLRLTRRPAIGRSLARAILEVRVGGRRLIERSQLRELRQGVIAGGGGVIQLSDGRHLEWTSTSLGEGAALPGYVLSLRDVSARMELEQLRDDLIAMLVHDLRTPLTSMIMSIDLLQYSRRDQQLQDEELLERARLSAHQMLRQVNTLLDMRKLEAGRMQIVADLYSVADLARQTIKTFELNARLSDLSLRAELPGDLPAARLDRGLIGRVLENLVGNALKFTMAGGSITIAASADAEQLRVEVIDDGVGIPEQLHATIFDKYIQAPEGRRRQGSGLGLAFCRLAVEAHGGQIGVLSRPGGGSIFWFALPLDQR